ncbi:MAG: hypothetical protein KGI29_01565 [Pseudomonadota bacterium]|nr:hypothetical protein [Pseudomonadota bacterium]MDE3038116.1 hypothetical protein [Pseudomonadota bacterium]
MIPQNQTPLPDGVERLAADFGLTPVTAAEIEFYLPGSDGYPQMQAFWCGVQAACKAAGIRLFKSEKEKGRDQHEVALMPDTPENTARDVAAIKTILNDVAEEHGLQADFAARPFPGQPGSGLHIHIHLADAAGRNVFYKDDDTISDALKFSIGGLLATMQKNMPVFAPAAESYNRFTPGGNAPLTVSWGANNRTVAVRLPDSDHDNKRIEHRVAGADADPEKVIAAILSGICFGLESKSDPGAQIYGDAGLETYGLPKLSASPPSRRS